MTRILILAAATVAFAAAVALEAARRSRNHQSNHVFHP
jgi:hypothetical protein